MHTDRQSRVQRWTTSGDNVHLHYTRMDFSVEGAVDRASSMFITEVTYATFESNFYAGWVHTTYREIGGQKDYAVFGHCVIQYP